MTSKCRLQCFFSLTFFQTLFVHKCIYPGRIRSLKNGCARYCNATVKVRRVCAAGDLIQATKAHTEASRLGSS